MKLIIADPHLTGDSPTMRGIVGALDRFAPLFSEIEVWATECEWEHPKVTWRKVPRIARPWAIQSQFYTWLVQRWARQLPPDGPGHLLQTSGCFLETADIRYIQFWNQAFFEESKKRPEFLKPDMKTRILGKRMAAREAKIASNLSSTGEWWVVSRNLANRIATETPGNANFRILPNSYDPTRFNHDARKRSRDEMRAHYGIVGNEHVLAFAAFGHFERKGVRQAVEAVQILRDQGYPSILLVFGGSDKTISAFRKTAGPTEGIRFAGNVRDIEKHLAAADGFFFPSHFEAFSLAEIEAAALGLRLYLTPHYGSEMILREPTNGRLLPWDPAGMAEAIARDIKEGYLGGDPHHEMGEAIDRDGYGEKLAGLYRDAIDLKTVKNG